MRSIIEVLTDEQRLNASRFKAMFADFDELKIRLGAIERELTTLPGVLADMIAQRGQSWPGPYSD
ncbi:hypothetical protein [Hyphomicrobium sp. CS1GBMeth3]|uniref:hypothetical protein n=1 Tax=Hyphomicrobium sp. CS1GBMeth3 TaxID=1892845 RepID=UPI000931B2D5|nr:hypothetical protein [Hyphomicrobium sp. CS1GBMeth3]